MTLDGGQAWNWQHSTLDVDHRVQFVADIFEIPLFEGGSDFESIKHTMIRAYSKKTE